LLLRVGSGDADRGGGCCSEKQGGTQIAGILIDL
jgi:hypothetical protein